MAIVEASGSTERTEFPVSFLRGSRRGKPFMTTSRAAVRRLIAPVLAAPILAAAALAPHPRRGAASTGELPR